MRRLLLLIASVVATVAVNAQAVGDTLATFAMTNYTGWTYTRSDTELNQTNIGKNKISLFTSSAGNVFALLSPSFTLDTRHNAVRVDARMHVNVPAELTSFDTDLLQLDMELYNSNNGKVLKKVHVPATADLDQTMSGTFLREDLGDAEILQLRLVAPRADKNLNLAVRKVTVVGLAGENHVYGDVNGDGNIDVIDINILINIILAVDSADDYPYPDANQDGSIDAQDINLLIGIILGL